MSGTPDCFRDLEEEQEEDILGNRRKKEREIECVRKRERERKYCVQ